MDELYVPQLICHNTGGQADCRFPCRRAKRSKSQLNSNMLLLFCIFNLNRVYILLLKNCTLKWLSLPSFFIYFSNPTTNNLFTITLWIRMKAIFGKTS